MKKIKILISSLALALIFNNFAYSMEENNKIITEESNKIENSIEQKKEVDKSIMKEILKKSIDEFIGEFKNIYENTNTKNLNCPLLFKKMETLKEILQCDNFNKTFKPILTENFKRYLNIEELNEQQKIYLENVTNSMYLKIKDAQKNINGKINGILSDTLGTWTTGVMGYNEAIVNLISDVFEKEYFKEFKNYRNEEKIKDAKEVIKDFIEMLVKGTTHQKIVSFCDLASKDVTFNPTDAPKNLYFTKNMKIEKTKKIKKVICNLYKYEKKLDEYLTFRNQIPNNIISKISGRLKYSVKLKSSSEISDTYKTMERLVSEEANSKESSLLKNKKLLLNTMKKIEKALDNAIDCIFLGNKIIKSDIDEYGNYLNENNFKMWLSFDNSIIELIKSNMNNFDDAEILEQNGIKPISLNSIIAEISNEFKNKILNMYQLDKIEEGKYEVSVIEQLKNITEVLNKEKFYKIFKDILCDKLQRYFNVTELNEKQNECLKNIMELMEPKIKKIKENTLIYIQRLSRSLKNELETNGNFIIFNDRIFNLILEIFDENYFRKIKYLIAENDKDLNPESKHNFKKIKDKIDDLGVIYKQLNNCKTSIDKIEIPDEDIKEEYNRLTEIFKKSNSHKNLNNLISLIKRHTNLNKNEIDELYTSLKKERKLNEECNRRNAEIEKFKNKFSEKEIEKLEHNYKNEKILKRLELIVNDLARTLVLNTDNTKVTDISDLLKKQELKYPKNIKELIEKIENIIVLANQDNINKYLNLRNSTDIKTLNKYINLIENYIPDSQHRNKVYLKRKYRDLDKYFLKNVSENYTEDKIIEAIKAIQNKEYTYDEILLNKILEKLKNALNKLTYEILIENSKQQTPFDESIENLSELNILKDKEAVETHKVLLETLQNIKFRDETDVINDTNYYTEEFLNNKQIRNFINSAKEREDKSHIKNIMKKILINKKLNTTKFSDLKPNEIKDIFSEIKLSYILKKYNDPYNKDFLYSHDKLDDILEDLLKESIVELQYNIDTENDITDEFNTEKIK